MTVRRLILLATSFGVLVATGAPGAEGPCRADVKKLCADVPAEGGKLVGCLKAHESEVSKACKEKIGEIKGRVGPLVGACQFDIAHFCSDVSPGGGRVASCLETNRDRLTPECRDRIGKAATP